MAVPVNGSTHLIPAYNSFIDPKRMKGWVGLFGWLVADGLPTLVVTHQLQVERRTGKVRRSETDVLPLCNAISLSSHSSLKLILGHYQLSSYQLRAASLIGRNAVTWLCALSTVRRSSWHVITCHRRPLEFTCRHMSRGRGWHVVNILRKWSHEFDSRPITKSNVIFCTLFCLHFVWFLLVYLTNIFLG